MLLKKPRGVARTEAEAKRYAEEDAAIAKAKEQARAAAATAAAAAAGARGDHTNGSLDAPVYLCTLPSSAIMTPSTKGPRHEGQKNMQDSTFSISGEFYDQQF